MTTTLSNDLVATDRGSRSSVLRRLIAGAAPFDGLMGIACLVAADRFGNWLSVSGAAVRTTGAVFLLAAVTGAWTLRRDVADVRAIVAANAAFAIWCLVVLGIDGPHALGATLLVVSAVASAGTAVAEHRLARA